MGNEGMCSLFDSHLHRDKKGIENGGLCARENGKKSRELTTYRSKYHGERTDETRREIIMRVSVFVSYMEL